MTADLVGSRLVSRTYSQDLYDTYAELRRTSPVHWSDSWGVWVMTRYDDVLATLKDSQSFSNSDRFKTFVEALPLDVQAEAATISRHNGSGMLQSDPPDHTRLRSLVRQAFTPRVVEGLRPRVEQLVDEYLDDIDPAGFDLIRDFSFRLPVTVVLELMGLPRSDSDRIATLATDVGNLQSTGRATSELVRRAAAAIEEIESYFEAVCNERRRHPGEDLISLMLLARDQGDQMTQEELISMSVNILFAGHQTTEHLIGNATLLLIDRPEVRRRLEQDPDLWGSAIEECLRFESPIQRGWRRVARDVEVRGKQLLEGQLAYLMLGAANRDPEVFPSPDEFDIERQPNRHLAFGYGIHFCIGAPLARIEAPIALRQIFSRFPSIHLAEPPTWQPNIHLRGLERLQLEA